VAGSGLVVGLILSDYFLKLGATSLQTSLHPHDVLIGSSHVVNVDLYSSLNLISLILIKTNTLYFIIFRIFRLFSVAKKSGYQNTVEFRVTESLSSFFAGIMC
jgi:hypothetical protein